MFSRKPPLFKSLSDLLYSGLPSNESMLREQVYLVNIYSLLGTVTLIVFGLIHVVIENNAAIGLLELLGACVFIMNIFSLRTTHNQVAARSIFLIVTLAIIMLTHISGDTQETGLFWLILYVASAFVLTGKRQGMWWIAGFFITTILILVMRRLGIISIPYSFIEVRQILVTLPIVVVGISIYQYFQNKVKTQTDKGREALLEQKIRAETVLENVSEGVIAIDSKKHIILMNKAAQDMLGWTFDEVVGKNFTDIVPALDEEGNVIQSSKRPVQKMLNSTSGLSQTMTYQRRNGTTFPVSIFGRSIIVNGKVLGVIGTFRDISEEQELEETKSEFVTLASHQLRTPISTIRWISETLLSGDAGNLSQEQWDYVNQIYASNQRSVSIVDSLLLASTMEIGAISVRPEPVNLSSLTHDLVDWSAQVFASAKEQHVSEHYPDTLPKIALDLELTKTILEAILMNAIKYTPNKGKISVTIIKSEMKLSPKSKGSVSVSITDTGYGIPKDQQKKVFAKLFRATNIKTKDTDGTGLSLHVVNMILKQVGGQIHFESRENKGSTFTVTFPLEGMIAHE